MSDVFNILSNPPSFALLSIYRLDLEDHGILDVCFESSQTSLSLSP